jgi:hypothetical protein
MQRRECCSLRGHGGLSRELKCEGEVEFAHSTLLGIRFGRTDQIREKLRAAVCPVGGAWQPHLAQTLEIMANT